MKTIWAWPFTAGWLGGYYRTRNDCPETEPGGAVYVLESDVEREIERLTAERDAAQKECERLREWLEDIAGGICHEPDAGMKARAALEETCP